MSRSPAAIDRRRDPSFIEKRQLAGSHEPHAGHRPGMLNVALEYPVGPFGGLGRATARTLPVASLACGTAREIHRVPELGGGKFSGMVVRADDTASACAQVR